MFVLSVKLENSLTYCNDNLTKQPIKFGSIYMKFAKQNHFYFWTYKNITSHNPKQQQLKQYSINTFVFTQYIYFSIYTRVYKCVPHKLKIHSCLPWKSNMKL